MKIKTLPSFFGQEVAISNDRTIKFDHKGLCEVDDVLGAELIENYSTFIFEAGQKVEKVKEPEEEMNDGVIQRFNEKIYDLEAQVKELKDAKKTVEADLNVWQNKVVEVSKEANFYKNKYSESEAVYSERIDKLELKISLMDSTSDELKKLCQASGYEEKEWIRSTKENLIEYILGKG